MLFFFNFRFIEEKKNVHKILNMFNTDNKKWLLSTKSAY